MHPDDYSQSSVSPGGGWMDYDRKLWQTCLLFTGQSIKELVIQKGQELVPFSSSYLDELVWSTD
ncbi:hypothetical protein ACP70R_022424 [Stipagrostis hirtigluma subsp. patula]